MVEAITDMPPGTHGFRISGDLAREDYVDTMIPPLAEAVDRGEKLRVLYIVDEGLHMEPGAVWEDLKMGGELGVKHRDAWERVAVVTDLGWLWRAFELFSWLVPGKVRLFHDNEIESAKAWLA